MFFDIETNGKITPHRIVQFSYIVIENGQHYIFDTLVDQPDISQDITTLTGITRNDIWKYGIPESDLASHVKSLLAKRPIMVAHNCQFDLNMVFDLLNRHYGTETAYDLCSNCNWLDTLTIAKDRFSYNAHGGHKLHHCIEHYNCKNVINSHNALDDVKALVKVFQAMMYERPDCIQYLNVFGFNPKYPRYGMEFGFISYKAQYYSIGTNIVDYEEILPLK